MSASSATATRSRSPCGSRPGLARVAELTERKLALLEVELRIDGEVGEDDPDRRAGAAILQDQDRDDLARTHGLSAVPVRHDHLREWGQRIARSCGHLDDLIV